MAVAGNRIRVFAIDALDTRRGARFGLLVAMALIPACSRPADTSIVAPANAATQAPAPAEAAPPPSALSPADGESEIDALLHDLRVAKDRVDRELARKEQLAVAQAEEERTAEPDATPAPAPKTTRPGKKKDAPAATSAAPGAGPRDDAERESPSDWVGSPCDTACRALASMERSAGRICSLAGESDTRCASARAMVKASRERVQAGGCWCRSFGPR